MTSIGYLSGAIRVSTLPNSETFGARSHILGWTTAARALGHDVHEYIVGDKIGASRPELQSEGKVRGGRAKTTLVDLARMASNVVHTRRSLGELRPQGIDVAYERFAAFQSLGRSFQKAGIPWIVETNGLYFEEASRDRNSMSLVGPARLHELAAYRDADLLVAVTPELAELIESRMSRRPRRGRTIVVPNGVDTATFAPVGPWRPQGDTVRIGFVGSVVNWMNLDRLLASARTLAAQGQSLEVVIVGRGDALAGLKERAAALATPGLTVSFPGALPYAAVGAALDGFDICFSGHLPLTGLDTMYHSPLKVNEYLAVGRRTVLPDYPFARTLAGQLPGLAVFDPQSQTDLERVLGDLIRAGDTAADAAARRAYVVGNHSWERRVETILSAAGQSRLETAVTAGG